MKPILLSVLLALGCACGSSQPTAQASPSPSASSNASASADTSPSASDEVPVDSQVLAPATDRPNGSLCSAPLQTTADGNATPLLCRTGAVNVRAWKFYATISASVLGLGLNPTQGQVESAICDDLNHNHATRPEEASGYKLATAYYGWAFTIDVSKVSC
jgi:hypothetical protein